MNRPPINLDVPAARRCAGAAAFLTSAAIGIALSPHPLWASVPLTLSLALLGAAAYFSHLPE